MCRVQECEVRAQQSELIFGIFPLYDSNRMVLHCHALFFVIKEKKYKHFCEKLFDMII